jgi:hypothetical protein
VETNRKPGRMAELGTKPFSQIAYSLTVRLKDDAPPGYVHDQLVLVTNDFDTRAGRVPVSVEGLVVSALSVRPSALLMYVTETDQPVTRNVVVQGRQPFRIVSARSSDDRFQCKVPTESKTAHVLPVTFTAKPGETSPATISATIRIETDIGGAGAVEVGVSAQMKPAATPDANAGRTF